MNIDEIMEMVMANEEVKNLSYKEKRAARPAFFCYQLRHRFFFANVWRIRIKYLFLHRIFETKLKYIVEL